MVYKVLDDNVKEVAEKATNIAEVTEVQSDV